MARDHRQLRVFHEAHRLVVAIYEETRHFPRDEWFGIRIQMRRSAVSVSSNIVEGNARRSTPEYVNFLNVARGSAAETAYLVALASELGYFPPDVSRRLKERCNNLIPQLERLIQRMELLVQEERRAHTGRRTRDQRLKTTD